MVTLTFSDYEMDTLLSLLPGNRVTLDDIETEYVLTEVDAMCMTDRQMLMMVVMTDVLSNKSITLTFEVPVQLFVSDMIFHNSAYVLSKMKYMLSPKAQ